MARTHRWQVADTHHGPVHGPVLDDRQRREAGAPAPGAAVIFVAWAVASWCIGFAVVNVVFEMTDHFADGPYAEYAAGISVMNWLVVALKVIGAVLALLSVSRSAGRVLPFVLATMLWGAAATLGLDAAGSVVEAIGIVTGLTGSAHQITLAGVAYVVVFVLGAAGYGALATSYSRRFRTGRWPVVLGVLGAPLMLGLIFVAVPMVLVALGVMPA